MKKSTKKGFTLVELVIVIAVIAILAAVLIPTFSNVVARANASADLQAITATLEGKFVEYVADAHKAPTGILVKATDTKTEFVDFVDAKFEPTEAGQFVYSKAVIAGKNGYAFVVALTGDGSYTINHVKDDDSEPLLYKEAIVDKTQLLEVVLPTGLTSELGTANGKAQVSFTATASQNFAFAGDKVTVKVVEEFTAPSGAVGAATTTATYTLTKEVTKEVTSADVNGTNTKLAAEAGYDNTNEVAQVVDGQNKVTTAFKAGEVTLTVSAS